MKNSVSVFLSFVMSVGLLTLAGGFVSADGHSAMRPMGPKAAKQRQVRQRKRIRQGVKSGELTKKEAMGLRKQQRKIHRTKRRALKDGEITPMEGKRIRRMQNRASKRIYKEKHDGDQRETQQEAPAAE